MTFLYILLFLGIFFRTSRILLFLLTMEGMNILLFLFLASSDFANVSMLCISFLAFSVMTFAVGATLLVMLSRLLGKEQLVMKMC